ncbi:MAG TPA: rRNA maturation RNase YbeY [Anaerolineae bacterium]|nr:rRNA maturation RNase YbeY [Anaerolineae bacterium]
MHTEPAYAHADSWLERAARATLTHVEAGPGELSLILVGEARMQEYNQQFANQDAPTDVLAFVDGTIDPESEMTYYGDVIICHPIADRQASQQGHSLSAEITLLAIHGVLHLLGYDHDAPETRQRMWSAQDAILEILGYGISSPEER